MRYLVKGAAIAAVVAVATPAFAQTTTQLNNAELARVAASVPDPLYPIVYPAYAAGAVATGAATAAVAVPTAAAATVVYPYQHPYPYPYPFVLAPLAVVPGIGWYYWDGKAWQWQGGTKS
jgi:hypothetical protein